MNPHRRSRFTSLIQPWYGCVSHLRTTLTVFLLVSTTNVMAQQPGWSATGSLVTGRQFHTATLLANGKVLVVGGDFSTGTAEVYDPATGQWSATGSISKPRDSHIAVRLANGKVLVAGGFSGANYSSPEVSAEIYDPDSGAWSAAGSLRVARASHAGTLLADGRVLVTGGTSGGFFGGSNTAELYDPATDVWSPAGTMNSSRYLHTATLFPDGKVLVAGGLNGIPLRSTELYDPATGNWTVTGDLITVRAIHTATLLHNGKVLVAGGGRDDYPYNHVDGVDNAELYDPATGQWTATGSLIAPRAAPATALLSNGRVLAAGGFNDGKDAHIAEVYDPDTGSWSVADSLNTARSFHTSTLLANGTVLVAGGSAPFASRSSAELYHPGFETPLLTLNSTNYCIGAPWNLVVIHSAREAYVRLLGVSNGASWEIARWGTTDRDGSFRDAGTMADGTEGAHTLIVEISGIRSTAVSFAVSKCKP